MYDNDDLEDARIAAEAAKDAAEQAAETVREQAELSDEQVARGVEVALGQQTLKEAAHQLEQEGWTVQRVEPGRITLTGAKQINWWVHGILPFFTALLSLIWTAKVMKRPRGTLTLTLDNLGRVQAKKA